MLPRSPAGLTRGSTLLRKTLFARTKMGCRVKPGNGAPRIDASENALR